MSNIKFVIANLVRCHLHPQPKGSVPQGSNFILYCLAYTYQSWQDNSSWEWMFLRISHSHDWSWGFRGLPYFGCLAIVRLCSNECCYSFGSFQYWYLTKYVLHRMQLLADNG